MGLGSSEMILIAIVILLMFGGKKLPELMRGLGKGVSEFKQAKDGYPSEKEEAKPQEPAKPAALNEAPANTETHRPVSSAESSAKAGESTEA